MKQFPIGVIADSFRLPFAESIAKAAEIGAQGVQLYAVEGELDPANMTAAKRAEARKLIEGYGLQISALCGDLGGHGFQIAAQNPAKIEKSKRIVDLALDMGTNIITTHISVIPEDSTCDRYKVMQEACNELAAYANQYQCYFAIETGPEPSLRLKNFLDSLDSKGVAVNMDPANLVMVIGEDPVEAVHNLKDYIVHTHAKDGIRIAPVGADTVYDFFAEGGIGDLRLDECFKELPLGQGHVDFAAYLQALEDIGYNGFLTIEREAGPTPEDDIRLAMDFLKKTMNQ
jgi:sugar phosphate isomerase/epimerase